MEAFAVGNYVTVREDEVDLDIMKGMQGKIAEIDDVGIYIFGSISLG